MKKLNRKGFTLIELLAVIVILAIILVVTVPNIISSINDARVSSIHNLAVAAANTYDNAFAQDLITTNKILGTIPDNLTSDWQCISSLSFTEGTGDSAVTTTLASILDLSTNDVVLDADVTTTPPSDLTTMTANDTYCSAIRVMANGSAEVLLVAKTGGKFAVAQNVVYALSSADTGAQNAVSAS